VETIKEVPCAASSRFLTPGSAIHCQEDSLSYAESDSILRDASVSSMQLRSWMIRNFGASLQKIDTATWLEVAEYG